MVESQVAVVAGRITIHAVTARETAMPSIMFQNPD